MNHIPLSAPDTRRQSVKLLHGVNCGPLSFGCLIDETRAFRDARFPLIRFHDINWPHAREVDYYTIFPNFDADAEDPANYDFCSTDEYIRQCLNTGAELVFRLGVGIEHASIKYHIHPPKDYDQLAKIFLGIVRHYTEGWADGFVCSEIKYWEIWNEPDLITGFGSGLPSPTWSGTVEEFCKLYETVSVCLKNHNPNLRIGGPALANLESSFSQEILTYIVSHKLPLDFCSWHCYSSGLVSPVRRARWLREFLDNAGYTHTLSILDEWDYTVPGCGTSVIFGDADARLRRDAFIKTMSEVGAAYVAAFLMTMQQEAVDEAAFFCADPCNLFSMFDHYGVPQKNYFAFRQFSDVAQRSTITSLQIPEDLTGLFYMKTEDSGGQSLLVSNFSERVQTITLLKAPGKTYAVRRTDKDNEYHLESYSGDQPVTLTLDGYCVLSIETWDN